MSVLLRHWSFDPFLVAAAVLAAANELGIARLSRRSTPRGRRRRRLRSLAFYGGLVLLALTVCSPIDYWSSSYFYIHMFQHVLLMFFAPALVVLGAPWLPLLYALPPAARRRTVRALAKAGWARPLRAATRVLLWRWTGVIVLNVVMVLWHVPALFDLGERNATVHIWLMHSSFFAAGILFWLQIAPSPPFAPKLSPLGQGTALVGTNVVMLLLAMTLGMFETSSIYSVYNHVQGVAMSPLTDQRIGAGILWVCGDLWALPGVIAVARRAIAEHGSLSNVVDDALRRAGAGVEARIGLAGEPPVRH